ncbi:hypothetical protein ElyMa_005854200 [Elysia marginata]|uniref:Secreted protein n=1 Tax=Elysia marginata TaxID=1093978 RepID=A0AAV4FZR5_9GAST|nr:hypothetical protein ElyMa_005854200 [Elysia marginata]
MRMKMTMRILVIMGGGAGGHDDDDNDDGDDGDDDDDDDNGGCGDGAPESIIDSFSHLPTLSPRSDNQRQSETRRAVRHLQLPPHSTHFFCLYTRGDSVEPEAAWSTVVQWFLPRARDPAFPNHDSCFTYPQFR